MPLKMFCYISFISENKSCCFCQKCCADCHHFIVLGFLVKHRKPSFRECQGEVLCSQNTLLGLRPQCCTSVRTIMIIVVIVTLENRNVFPAASKSENLGSRPEKKKKTIMIWPPHLRIGKLQYIRFFFLISSSKIEILFI